MITAVYYSLFSIPRHTQANLSYWAPPCVVAVSVVWVRAVLLTVPWPHTSFYLGEMLIMRVIHSALGELLVVQITWKCTQEFRIVWPLDLWAFQYSGQALLKICIHSGTFSHTIKWSVTSGCFFTHCVGLNVTAVGLTLLEGERETFSQGCSYISQLGLSVLFVCFSYKPCWYICMIMHFWRYSWMGLSPFCLYSGLSLSQFCIGQWPKFCCLFSANNFHLLLDNTEALGAAYDCVCLGTELKTQSVSC